MTVRTYSGWVASIVVSNVLPISHAIGPGAMISVNTDRLNLREEPGLNGFIIATYNFNAIGTVLTAEPVTVDDMVWQRVEIADDTNVGWFAEQFIDPSAMGGTGYGVIIADGPLALRSTPGIDGHVITQVPTGTAGLIRSTGLVNADGYNWVEISITDMSGRTGWVASEYLSYDLPQ